VDVNPSSSAVLGKPAVELPEALLNARLADEDKDVRLRAAALMALEGSEDGVAYLHKAWRAEPDREHGDLLSAVLLGAWHDDYVPLVEEYAAALRKESYTYPYRDLLERLQRAPGTRARALLLRLKAAAPKDY
jgi:hypothetical protein